jgi:hypothetical protein
MVADAGCDPTGSEPCDAALQRAAADRTLLKFPEGEYRFTETNVLLDYANLGLLGDGDVRFSVPEEFNEKLIVIDRGTGALFENIDIDLTAAGATPGLHLAAADDLEIHDVEFVGQGIHPDSEPRNFGNSAKGPNGNPDVTNALFPIVRSPDGTGVVENVVAHNAGLMGAYTRGGVWIGISTRGTITLRDCAFSGFPGNGVYASRTNGVVRIEGGTYRNNDVSQVRIGSEGSYVRDATIAVDSTSSRSPNPSEALNQRGIRFEGAKIESGRPVARDCDVTIAATPHSEGGVVANGTCGEFLVADTRIGIGEDYVRGVQAKVPNGGPSYPPPPRPHGARLRGVSVTGPAAEGTAIELRGRQGSTIEACCIQQGGANRDGITLVDSPNSPVRDATIDVTGRPVERFDSPGPSDVTTAGSCPVPSRPAGGPGVGPDAGSTGVDLSHVLTIASQGTQREGTRASYRLAVDGELEPTTANDATIDDTDDVSGSSATGQVGLGGRDSYRFTGVVEAFDVDGTATVTLDGEEIDPDAVIGKILDTLTVESTSDERASYTFTVDGELEPGERANLAEATVPDAVDGDEASGSVAQGGVDDYRIAGPPVRFDLDGPARVAVDGRPIDPSALPSEVVTFAGGEGRGTYDLSVDGELRTSIAKPGLADPNDTVLGGRADGQVGPGGRDSYGFDGEITGLDVSGDVTVSRNGTAIDPDEFLPPVDTLTISSRGTLADGTRATYRFVVDGGVKKSGTHGATIDDNDAIEGAVVSGQVGGGGRDSYRLVGDVLAFRLDGEADLTLDGAAIDPAALPGSILTIASEGTQAEGTRASYEVRVSGAIEPTTANDATIDDSDSHGERRASGQVGLGGRDSYGYSGVITGLDVDGTATITVNGQEIDAERFV